MKEVSVNGFGLSTMCRLCLTRNVTLLSLFEFLSAFGDRVAEIVMKCAPVQIRRCEEMPNFICQSCFTQLKKSYQFQMQIIQSEKTLRRYLHQLRPSYKQMKVECSIQEPSKVSLIHNTNTNTTMKNESLELHDVFDMDADLKKEESSNCSSAEVITEKVYLKSKIKEEPNGVNSSIPTKSVESLIETLFEDDDSKTSFEDSDIDEKSENLKEKLLSNCSSAEKIIEEMSLKSEIKEELKNVDTSIPTKCTNSFIETLSEDDGSKTSFEESDIEEKSENLKEKGLSNCASAEKIIEEMSLKSEIKEEMKNVDSSIPTKGTDGLTETLFEDDNSKISFENSDVEEKSEKAVKRKDIHKNTSEIHKYKKIKKKYYKCDICDKRFSYLKSFNTHTRRRTCEKPCESDVSGSRFFELSELNPHKRIHTGEKSYKCEVCSQRFRVWSTLINHTRTHVGEKPLKCDVCGKRFRFAGYLNLHKRKHIDGKLDCDVCGKHFKKVSHFNYHKRIHSEERPYKCDVCGTRFKYLEALNCHKRIHSEERPYQCDVCNKRFKKSDNMKLHKRVHTGVKPYMCDVCGASFNQPCHLKYHIRIHTGERPFKCDVCNSCFKQRTHLINHKRVHTGEKPFKCDVCNKRFKSDVLKAHKRTHTGEKPYMCVVCGARFNHLGHLNYHKRIHTGEKPFKCDVCDSCFQLPIHLKNHKRTHTTEKDRAE